MSEKKKVISVMIPTYNEEENARPIYEAVRDEIRKDCPDYDYEILFIDGIIHSGSPAAKPQHDAWRIGTHSTALP